MPDTCDVAIIGGGVVGCAVAHRLAADGRSVVLVESGPRLGLGASDAAMGGITPQSEPSCLGPLGAVAGRSRELYPAWLDELAAASGVVVPLLDGGDIQVALDEAEMERLETEVLPVWTNSPFAVERLTAADARGLEPLLSESVAGGFLLPDELALDPRDLLAALAATLEANPAVRVLTGTRATAVTSGPRGARAYLDGGDRVSAGFVVVAAGLLSRELLPGLRDHLLPIKGMAYDARVPEARSYPLRHHVYAEFSEDGVEHSPYLVPRHDGRVAIGVTYEIGAEDLTVTGAGLAEIRRGLEALMPAAVSWPVERRWAGLRPATTDRIPIIGPVDANGYVLAATGHGGLGITLAPVTADLVAALVRGGADAGARELLRICRPDRPLVPWGPDGGPVDGERSAAS
ncbi:NAD(P)/FAD-dependent oxidoreductase [Microbispora sp. ATCC PTA-5024]|uniref:NAD(P)/FAD-dependent oxidoreductase n=1 Tax=Microbispora sp. ATCC PTA-5024 TaxID=316330 RepID=UPI0003DDB271|nr:FAD-dependent oxidoreductase [Microbispora sp. ATCC PTA-5024]ETK32341.1 hypothetical protein MPTA5024_30280 [Microbispora sp. ATCC PTA-5024]